MKRGFDSLHPFGKIEPNNKSSQKSLPLPPLHFPQTKYCVKD